MSDSTPDYATVRVKFNPYSHQEVQKFLRQVHTSFGKDKNRWYYVSPPVDSVEENVWVLDFTFKDPHDAIMFSLKYAR
jgi:uncharacterized protein YchJ